MKKDYSHALSFNFQALNSARQLKDDQEIANCLNNIATLYSTLGDNEKSIEYYSEALKLSQSFDRPAKLFPLIINLGLSYQILYRLTTVTANNAKAIDRYKDALNLALRMGDEFSKNLSLAHIGKAYADLKQYDKALQFLQPALETAQKRKDSVLSSSILTNIGMIFLNQENCPRAQAYFDQALAEIRKDQSDPVALRIFYGLGRCQENKGNYDQAISRYNECLRIIDRIGANIVDDINRAGYLQDKTEIYQRLINLYYELFQKTKSPVFEKEIFYTAEKAKARSFVEYLERLGKSDPARSARPSNALGEKLRISRLEILKKLSSASLAQEARSQLENQVRQIDDQTSVMNAEEFGQTNAAEILAKPVTVEFLQQRLLNADTALVEYFLGKDRSYLIFVSNSAFKIVELAPQDKLENTLIGYLNYLQDLDVDQATGIAAARRLYKELIAPIADLIPKSATNLIIVPDGILFHLPFETLCANQSGPKAEYLMNRYFVSYAPSATAFFYLSKRPKPAAYAKDLLAFGAPAYPEPSSQGSRDFLSAGQILLDLYEKNGFSVFPIPYSEKEVEEIARHFRTDKKDIFLNREASEENLKRLDLGDYRIVHFACHAFSDETYPFRSALVLALAGESDEDGFFQVLEMYPLRLSSELTVLSACRTGSGKTIGNEGILGLPRVFFYMGSRSVISTLWSINDKAAARFMRYFYDSYSRGQGKAKSLQLAKQRMMKTRYGHPYYWAAFILTGEY